MIKRWAHYTLSQVIEKGARDAALVALKGCDPLIKPFAKRKSSKDSAAQSKPAEATTRHTSLVSPPSLSSGKTTSQPTTTPTGWFANTTRHSLSPIARNAVLWSSLAFLGTGALLTAISVGLYFHLRGFEPAHTPVGHLMEESFTQLAVGAANGSAEKTDSALRQFRAESEFQPVAELESLAQAAAKVRGNGEALDPYRNAGT